MIKPCLRLHAPPSVRALPSVHLLTCCKPQGRQEVQLCPTAAENERGRGALLLASSTQPHPVIAERDPFRLFVGQQSLVQPPLSPRAGLTWMPGRSLQVKGTFAGQGCHQWQ